MSGQPGQERLTLWPVWRWRLAAVTGALVIATALGIALVGGTVWHRFAAIVYVAIAVVALITPQAIGWQVATGVGVCWSLLPMLHGAATFALVPVVVCVATTSELLGITGRLRMVVERAPISDLRRLPLAVVLTAVVSAVTLFSGQFDGPGGLTAVVLAVGACVLLALVLAGDRSAAGPKTSDE
jgi:hypothetical protein